MRTLLSEYSGGRRFLTGPVDHAVTMLLRNKMVTVGLLMVGLVVALGVAIAVHHNPLGHVDTVTLDWIVGHRSAGGVKAVAGVTDLFGPAWVVVWTVLAAAVFFLLDRNVVRGLTIMATVAVAGALGGLIKLVIGRARPPFVDQVATYEATQSFPSGHVTGTTALVMAVALAATVTAARRRRIAAVTVALLVSVVAATTRLYLGLHWVSDVLAAIAIGTAAAIAVPGLVLAVLGALRGHTPQRIRGYLGPSPSPDHEVVDSQEGRHRAPVAS